MTFDEVWSEFKNKQMPVKYGEFIKNRDYPMSDLERTAVKNMVFNKMIKKIDPNFFKLPMYARD